MSRIEKFKQHFVDHKQTYIGVGIGVLIGGATVYLVSNKGQVNLINSGNWFNWKSNFEATVHQINIPAPGNHGNVIQCLETGHIYPSQNAAARELNIPQGNISKQLNGYMDTANGLTFQKIAEGNPTTVLTPS